MIRLLSHPLAVDTPTYPNTPGVTFQAMERTADGANSNWLVVTTQNHAATHVDGPFHFNPSGRRITEIDPGEFFFRHVVLIDIPKSDDEVITGKDFAGHEKEIEGSDMVLVRTGYGARWRAADPVRYSNHSPGFHSSAGLYLKERHPSVRAVAMDFLSAACQAFVDEGIEFHRIMLGSKRTDPYVFLIEDARIDADLKPEDLGLVVMAPLLLQDQDGGQVTMLAAPRGWLTT
jgi:arylformamidase